MSAATKRLRGICTGSATVILLIATQSSLGPLQARATANGPTTESQAFAQAAQSGAPVQIDTLTTKDTAIFANPNGTLTAQLSAEQQAIDYDNLLTNKLITHTYCPVTGTSATAHATAYELTGHCNGGTPYVFDATLAFFGSF